MNIKGIEILRKLNLPGPVKETIFSRLSDINLDCIYEGGGDKGLAVMAFDRSVPVDQLVYKEIKARKYKVQKDQIENVIIFLSDSLRHLGVKEESMVYLVNQMYTPETIAFSGKATIYYDEEGFGIFCIDAVKSLRKDTQEFEEGFSYQCPIIGAKAFRSEGKITKNYLNFPEKYVSEILRDIQLVSQSCCIDFEIYNKDIENGKLFYHDMSIISRK